MDMVSTKELANIWQVSPSRIVRLAKADRIPGARLVGKSWVFPRDVEKPADGRRRDSHMGGSEPDFRFPLYFYTAYTPEEIEKDFTEDERILYQGEALHYHGEFQKSCDLLTPLLKTTRNRYVRSGVLFYLCVGNIYLHHPRQAYQYFNEINLLYTEEASHKTELGFLLHNLETYLIGNRYYIEDFSIDMSVSYPSQMKEFLILECAYSDLLRIYWKDAPAKPELFEICCQFESGKFSALSSLTLHLYTSIICSDKKFMDRGILHLREACRIAEENGMEMTLAYMMQYMPDLFRIALKDWKPELLSRLMAMSSDFTEAFRRVLEYRGKNSILQVLDMNDFRYISFAVKGMANKEIASALRLSINTVSKKYSALFEKTGTHSKGELARIYSEALNNY